MSDQYAGIELPTPPKGYRLARWGESYSGECLWWGYIAKTWMLWAGIRGGDNDYISITDPEQSIFAIPKPRVRIPLEVMW